MLEQIDGLKLVIVAQSRLVEPGFTVCAAFYDRVQLEVVHQLSGDDSKG